MSRVRNAAFGPRARRSGRRIRFESRSSVRMRLFDGRSCLTAERRNHGLYTTTVSPRPSEGRPCVRRKATTTEFAPSVREARVGGAAVTDLGAETQTAVNVETAHYKIGFACSGVPAFRGDLRFRFAAYSSDATAPSHFTTDVV